MTVPSEGPASTPARDAGGLPADSLAELHAKVDRLAAAVDWLTARTATAFDAVEAMAAHPGGMLSAMRGLMGGKR